MRAQIDGEWKTEIVRDAAVIAAYVRNRQILEEETTLEDTIVPTGDLEKDARVRKRYVVGGSATWRAKPWLAWLGTDV